MGSYYLWVTVIMYFFHRPFIILNLHVIVYTQMAVTFTNNTNRFPSIAHSPKYIMHNGAWCMLLCTASYILHITLPRIFILILWAYNGLKNYQWRTLHMLVVALWWPIQVTIVFNWQNTLTYCDIISSGPKLY